tara:strand:+ start:116 stop:283 length:168 start_codon:yes stop_codon:yes gene_type:complete
MSFETIKVKDLFEENDELIGRIFPISLDKGSVSNYKLLGFDTPYAILEKIFDEEE